MQLLRPLNQGLDILPGNVVARAAATDGPTWAWLLACVGVTLAIVAIISVVTFAFC